MDAITRHDLVLLSLPPGRVAAESFVSVSTVASSEACVPHLAEFHVLLCIR
jgi:hypothetical protein